MFDSLFEHETGGVLKAMTLEWKCPRCQGMNFRILNKEHRPSGLFHTRCRYCRAKFGVRFPPPAGPVAGENEFLDRITDEDFSDEEIQDMIRDFAEIEYLRADRAPAGVIREKQKALEQKIDFARRRRR